ncbi:unnamed protein product [Cuscuta epithymum]|uniref:Transmembrane protein n=1 Tax=Cuscuta epithymum TaxID=186058 RepID=A0AAV0FWM3_9ASTE|nr:unnamed protein product [Cuscuta epithymum]
MKKGNADEQGDATASGNAGKSYKGDGESAGEEGDGEEEHDDALSPRRWVVDEHGGPSDSIPIDPKTMRMRSIVYVTTYFLHYCRIVLKKLMLLNAISFSLLLLASMLFAVSFLFFFLSKKERKTRHFCNSI